MRRRHLAPIALVLCAAPAAAEQLQYGIRSEAFWTDNAFGTAEDQVSDTAGRLSPWVDVSDATGRVTWGLRASPIYEYYVDQSKLRGFDYDVGGRLGWSVGDRTTLRLTDRFLRYHNVTSFNDQAAPGESIVPIGQRQRYTYNTTTASLDHQLSPVDRLTLAGFVNFFDFSEESQLDRNYVGANLAYGRTLSERTTVGATLSWSRQETDRVNVTDDVTDYYNLSGNLSYSFSPTLNLSLSAGPALIDSNPLDPSPPSTIQQFPLSADSDGPRFFDADTCPLVSGVRVLGFECETIPPTLSADSAAQVRAFGVPVVVNGDIPDVGGTSTTYFASASLTKEWERGNAVLAYSRSAGQATSLASVSDLVSGSVQLDLDRRWSMSFGASYERREQADETFVLTPEVQNVPAFGLPAVAQAVALRPVTLDSDSGVDALTLSWRVAYEVGKNSSVSLNTLYTDNSGRGDLSTVPSADRFVVSIGFVFSSDPLPF